MVTVWLRFLFRQIAIALVIVTSILLLSEILLPASILPYFNLHILVLITIAIAVISPTVEEKSRVMRYALCATLTALLLLYARLIFGMSVSGLMLLVALAILLIGLTVALVRRETNSPSEGPTSPSVPLLRKEREVVIEETIIIEETDVFMR